MNNIELILKLMEPDLNDYQLSKLKNVLQTILRTSRPALPNDELIKRFIQHKKLVGLKETSLISYTNEVKHMGRFFKDKNFTEYTTADIKEFLSTEYITGEHKIQANTLQTKIRYISSFYEFLVNEEFIERNPTARIERIMVEKKIKKAFTEEEIKALREACISKRDRAFLEFLYSTGARISEVITLNVCDCNFNESEVIVFGKGHKERIVYLSDIASKYLQEYLEERGAKPEDPLFTTISIRHTRMQSRAAQLLLREIGERAGVENVHPHRFRRTMATHAMERGMPIEQIKEILGHAKLDTTMIYCNVNSGKVKASFKECFNDRESFEDLNC